MIQESRRAGILLTGSETRMRHRTTSRRGFSLTELVVVIAIIAVLMAIAIPVVSKIRRSAQTANTKNFISQLDGAINRYYGDFHGYPGPLTFHEIDNALSGGTPGPTVGPGTPFPGGFQTLSASAGYDIATVDQGSITMSENLVLGLLGGFRVGGTALAPSLVYDPTSVGRGPNSLNVLNPKHYDPYIDTANLFWRDSANGKTGQYQDQAGTALDSKIPEFVDTFPSPMPILYLRARVGAASGLLRANWTPADNSIITDNTGTPPARVGQYDISQYIAYTTQTSSGGRTRSIGEDKTVREADYVPTLAATEDRRHGLSTVLLTATMDKGATGYQYPYNAFNYFSNPSIQDTARQKDQYILISAGADRVYGTDDDICSFGSVK